MAEPPVVVVGQIARDLVLVVDDVPGPGGTVDVDRRRELLGGKGANIAVGLAQLGVPVALVCIVGDDLVGAELLAQCERDHLDTAAVRRRARTESALMVDVVTADRQWRYFESVPAGGLLTPGDIEQAAARTVATDLLNRGPDLVVIAVGRDGNLVAWPEGAVMLPLIESDQVVDTTGGGDAFVAALTWALDRGEDPVRAGQLATAAAGLVVRHPGGRPALKPATVEEWADRVGAHR